MQEASLNRLVPQNTFENFKPSNILDFPATLSAAQNSKPIYSKQQLRQTHFFNRAMLSKRFALMRRSSVSAQPAQSPIASSAFAKPQSQNKRSARGVYPFAASFVLLLCVQVLTKSTPTPVTKLNQVPVGIQQATANTATSLDAQITPSPIDESQQLKTPTSDILLSQKLNDKKATPAIATLPDSKILAQQDARSIPELLSPVAKLDKTQVDQKLDAALIDTHPNLPKQKITKAPSLAHKKFDQPIVEAQLNSYAAIKDINTLEPTKAGNLKSKLNSPRSLSRPRSQPILSKKTLDNLDPQEAAVRDRAASKLDLARLGIDYGVDAFMNAAQTGNTYVLKLLLAGGMPPDVKNHQGQTALTLASQKGYTRVVQQLIRAGAHQDQPYQQSLIIGHQETENDVKKF